MKKEKIGAIVLLIGSLTAILILLFKGPILQDELYHSFVDTREFLNIPNFWNVMSNYSFIIVGALGVINFIGVKKSGIAYLLFFMAIILVGIGSGYYHLFPDNHSLVWDRLPMTIVFMTLFSIIISEHISEKLGRLLLFPFVLIGLFSIGYWVFSESGDLRLYAFVQFYPMFAIPVILIFFKSKFTVSSTYWIALLAYLIAKIFEYFDAEIYYSFGFISGHSLKHIIASLGLYVLLNTYKKRNLVAKKSLGIFPDDEIGRIKIDSIS